MICGGISRLRRSSSSGGEEACQAYWIEARWGGEPACARRGSKRVWAEHCGFLFQCADYDHQTSLTLGTLFEKTSAGESSMVLVATETDGCVRLAHADNDEATLKRFAKEHVAAAAEVTTDGLASYNPGSLGDRPQEISVQTPTEP
jgi:hypothetical protein